MSTFLGMTSYQEQLPVLGVLWNQKTNWALIALRPFVVATAPAMMAEENS